MVKVTITKTGNDLYTAFIKVIDDIDEKIIAPSDRVLIKHNLVEPADPDSSKITTPEFIEVVARYCLDGYG